MDEPVFKNSKEVILFPKDRPQRLSGKIRSLLGSEPYGVLCTQGRGQPYGSVVAFAASRDLKYLLFATPVFTRKFSLLQKCPRVAFVVDNRGRFPDDMSRVEAVTATGRSRWVRSKTERSRHARVLSKRHPQLKHFLAAASCAVIRVDVSRYFHVTRFQEVNQWLPS